MDMFRRKRVKSCVNRHAQPQVPGLLKNGQDAGLVHIEILIIRVQLDPPQPQSRDALQFRLPVGRVRVNRAERDHRIGGDGGAEVIDGFLLGGLGGDAEKNALVHPPFPHFFQGGGQRSVGLIVVAGDRRQFGDHLGSQSVGKDMNRRINQHER